MKKSLWTEDEVNILLKNLHLSNKELSVLLNRSSHSICNKKKRMNLNQEKEKYTSKSGEIFKPIKELDNKFLVSNFGTVVNSDYVEMKQTIFKDKKKKSSGYKTIKFSINGKSKTFRIHRLVAMYFVENTSPERIHVNHIDGDSLNNHFSNLEWCTPQENSLHAIKNNLFNPIQSNKLSETDVKNICIYLCSCKPNETLASISKMFNIHEETLRNIYHGNSWKHLVGEYKHNFTKLNSIR